MQQLFNDAATAGTAVAKAFVDAFEESNRSPSAAELAALADAADRHFAAQPIVWTDPALIEAWRAAMQYHLAERLKIFRRPQKTSSFAPTTTTPIRAATPDARWSGRFGIIK